LLHLLDASSETVLEDLEVVERELASYGHGLIQKPRLVVLNKADLLDDQMTDELASGLEEWGKGRGAWLLPRPLVVSAATSRGLQPLLDAVWRELDRTQSS
jgi:GTP-binding protein